MFVGIWGYPIDIVRDIHLVGCHLRVINQSGDFKEQEWWFSNVQQVMVTLLSKKVIVGQLTIPLRGFNKEALCDLINMGIQPAIADTTGKKRDFT